MHDFGFLRDLVILFSLAVVVVILCHRMRLPAIVGFLLTGIIAGPDALGLIHDKETVERLAEIGVVLLLFTVGIEFSIERLVRIRSVILVGGGLQVLLTGAVVATAAGILFALSPAQCIFLGMLVALSSTAVVLKLLSEKGELESPQGRIALGILIFQDLCIVPMMVATPFLAGEGGTVGDAVWTFVKAGLMILGAFVCGRFAVPWVLGQVVRTRNRETFLLITIILCLGTAWVSALAGLSLALGAFLAGLIVSQSEYSHQVLGEIVPFRDAFSSLFFISIGMLLDIGTFADPLPLFAGLVGLILIKATIAWGVSLILGYTFRVAVLGGMTLAQIGEFSFVLAKPGLESGLLNPELYQLFLAAAVLTMILTPFLKAAAPWTAKQLHPFVPAWLSRLRSRARPPEEATQLQDHVVILGFGPAGQQLAQVLKTVGAPYVIVEMNPETITKARARGEPIFYGDAQRPEILEFAGVRRARVLVIAVSDASSVRQATHLARRIHPGLHIIVRTRYLSELQPLLEIGASEVVPEELETSIEIFSRTLRHLLVPRDIIESTVQEVRRDGYGILRADDTDGAPTTEQLSFFEGANVEVVRVEEGAPVAEKMLAESQLRTDARTTILALQQGEKCLLNPPATEYLHVGTAALLFGSTEQLARAGELFRTPLSESETEPAPVDQVTTP